MTKADTAIHKDFLREQEKSEALLFLRKLISLQAQNPESFSQQTSNVEFIQIIQEQLQNVPTAKLLELCGNNQEFQTFLIQIVFIQREDTLYREGTGRKSIQATWSDKLISLVGRDGKSILNGVVNHLGDAVRTKNDHHYKAAEKDEIMSEHSAFLEKKLDSSISKVMAEVADAIYNLTQLVILDKNNKEHYTEFINSLAKIYNVTPAELLSLVIAKYHHRMYVSRNGINAHQAEDSLVKSVIQTRFPQLTETEQARKTINASFGLFNEIFPIIETLLRLNLQLFCLQEYILQKASS